MRAIGFHATHPIEHAESLLDLDLPDPTPGPRDLLVRVAAVSVNPVDTKVRASRTPQAGTPEVLGWDAVGTVQAVGAQVQHYQVGDRVFYAGAIHRPGTNAELHVVDERIVGRAPLSQSDAQAAAMPLTAITAWELLFDRLGVAQGGGQGQSLLIVGGAGGVGSMLIQLARQLTQLQVVATASRPETRQWCLDLGAHAVIDHRQPFAPQLPGGTVDLVAALTQTDQHLPQIVDALRPQGRLALIDDPKALDVSLLKRKSLSLHWELMFTRSLFETPDMAQQRLLLNEVAALADAGRIRSTVQQVLAPINAAHLRQAHALIESGKALGKVVLQGWH
jgi:zinc-binding alcohol dehydrogenase family protein